jgi:hypothetical protein
MAEVGKPCSIIDQFCSGPLADASLFRPVTASSRMERGLRILHRSGALRLIPFADNRGIYRAIESS